MQLTELSTAIIEWANKRNLIDGSTPQKQVKKLMSEFGELSDNLAKGKDIKDDIGDIFVVTTIICGQLKIKLDLSGYIGHEVIATPFDIDTLYRHMLNSLAPFVTAASLGHLNPFTTGSVLFSLEQLAQCVGSSLLECVQIAYNDIKDRRGVMFDGVFIKSTDVRYGEIKYPHILKAAEVICEALGKQKHPAELVLWLNDLDETGLDIAEECLNRVHTYDTDDFNNLLLGDEDDFANVAYECSFTSEASTIVKNLVAQLCDEVYLDAST